MSDEAEMVHHPHHYNAAGPRDADGTVKYEPVKVIESWGFAEGFYLGSAVKYILRAPHKGAAALDLNKALWYLQRLAGQPHVAPTCSDAPMDPTEVAKAWSLSEELTTALLHISCCNVEAAAACIARELATVKMADEIAEVEDARTMAAVELALLYEARSK